MRWRVQIGEKRRRQIPPLGMPAFAAFLICVASGILLVPVYRPAAPFDSLALLLLKNPAGSFVRSLHYWSALAFLVLTLAHVADHLIQSGEFRVHFGVWLRLSLSVPALIGVMLSGFLLRGDAAAGQALPVLRSLLEYVPLFGAALSRIFTGSGSDLTTVYLHHAATLTIILWLVTIEHARYILPRARTLCWTLPPLLAMSFLLVPELQWRATEIEKGPWYFAGLQELLHWMPWPQVAVWLLLLGLLLLILLPKLTLRLHSGIKWSMAAAIALYAALTVVGIFFRGEGWKFQSPAAVWAGEPHFLSLRAYYPVEAGLLAKSVPMVAGRREGCLLCHSNMTGFVAAHDPKTVGCASCHLGNPLSLNKIVAHSGMTLTPGNLSVADQTCGASNCHADVAARVHGSPMNTMSGVIAVDKFVFAESADLNAHFDVAALRQSPADTHLRQLCASCHLGQDKDLPAPISESSRGGGCSACHLRYDAACAAELARRGGSSSPLHHPDISIHTSKDACFGCHSRSGRISTNFEGWQETQLDEATAKNQPGRPAQFRVLDDERVFEKHPADVHFEKGMICVDCHLASEVMSDGSVHAHESDAVKISCADCHAIGATPAKEFSQLDAETQQIAAMRKLNEPGRRFVVAASGSSAYPNAYLAGDARPRVVLTESGQILQPKPAAAVCVGAMHRRLTCGVCHSAWAPQCVTCHTSFDSKAQGWDYLAAKYVKGAWEEESANLESDAPVLGVERKTSPDGKVTEQIATFVPGMILDLQIPGDSNRGKRFQRLYAPASPHTIAAKSRDCRSCHTNPAALGYGRGRLQYVVNGRTGEWRFTPAFSAGQTDGLPGDAWIGFLRQPAKGTATRENVRPFSLEEQQRILLVGACLTCHSEKEPRIAAAFADFSHCRSKLSPQCSLPGWGGDLLPHRIVR